MKNDISELREHLFATLRGLRDTEHPMELDRARAVSQVAGTIIESARVEVEFARVTNRDPGSGFIPTDSDTPALPNGITSVTRHRLKG